MPEIYNHTRATNNEKIFFKIYLDKFDIKLNFIFKERQLI